MTRALALIVLCAAAMPVQAQVFEVGDDGKLSTVAGSMPASTETSSRRDADVVPAKPIPQPFRASVLAAAERYALSPWLIDAVARTESGYDADVVSSAGAIGVMQLMPDTARELGITDGYAHDQSIRGGARYLSSLLRRYQGDYTRAAAAYNAGIGAVAKYGGVPPYKETLEYVQKVEALHILYRQALKLPPLKPKMRAAQ